MTAGAGAGYGGVIHAHRSPTGRDMTTFTTVGRSDVLQRLPWGAGAVVAACTVIGETAVVDIHL